MDMFYVGIGCGAVGMIVFLWIVQPIILFFRRDK